MAAKDWYEENIEAGVRPLVRLLRDHGINTYYSCEHAMAVEAECYGDGDASYVQGLLEESGYRHFRIEMTISYLPGQGLRRNLRVLLPLKDGCFCTQ